MNSKRRADLQRKLSMGAVPRPPADLARRIKADIPRYLEAHDERERTRWPLGLTLRVAATIITLITTAFVTMQIMQPDTRSAAKSVAAARPVPAILRGTPQDSAGAPPAATQAADEVRVDIFQDVPVAQTAPVATHAPLMVARAESASADAAASGGAASNAVQETPPTRLAEVAPEPAPAPMAPPPPPAEMPVAPAPAATAATSSLIREAYAKELDLQQKKSLFGISVDPQAFQEIKTSIERGVRPEAEEVNVDALVNYFAGAPSRAPKRGIALDVEASPAPARAEGNRAVLRLTIDTPRVEAANRASPRPAAQNVRIEIDIDESAVKSFRRIGGPESLAPEATLLENSSVTALYELELQPKLKSSQHVATVRLHYRSLSDGREQTITRIVHGHDLAKNWARATKRHRLASLGAIWSESLKGTPMDIDLRQRAEELAKQNPSDERARELANAAALGGGER